MKQRGLNRLRLLACWTARELWKKEAQPGVNKYASRGKITRLATNLRPQQPGFMLNCIRLGRRLTFKQLRRMNIFTHCIYRNDWKHGRVQRSVSQFCFIRVNQAFNAVSKPVLKPLTQQTPVPCLHSSSGDLRVVVSCNCTVLITAACDSLSLESATSPNVFAGCCSEVGRSPRAVYPRCQLLCVITFGMNTPLLFCRWLPQRLAQNDCEKGREGGREGRLNW